jgi:hypothetical protein
VLDIYWDSVFSSGDSQEMIREANAKFQKAFFIEAFTITRLRNQEAKKHLDFLSTNPSHFSWFFNCKLE